MFLLDWTDDDLVAQCVIFFLAGFDASSITMAFMTHELAVNPFIQQKLYEEVCAVQKELNGQELDYTAINNMQYMDMVVSETLRRWTPSPMTERLASRPYILEASDGTKVHLKAGEGVWLPIYAIHMDEKYYPNPEIFDPERFNDKNKQNIRQGTYLPFGIGPSECSI